jgi:hypothetical protein
MTLNIEQDKSFDLPEGTFRAQFVESKPVTKFKDGKLVTFVRLVFEVITDDSDTSYYAGRNFLPATGKNTPLREFLESWLGSTFFEKKGMKKLDLNTLIGRQADIVIRHIVNGENLPAFRHLAAIYPPGTTKAQEIAPKFVRAA